MSSMSSFILSHLRSNKRCLQISVNLTKRMISSDLKSFNLNKSNECLKYYPMIGSKNYWIEEMDWKVNPIGDQSEPKQSYILRTLFANPNNRQMNRIFVPNVNPFDRNKSNEVIDSDISHITGRTDTNGSTSRTELPAANGLPIKLYLDYRIIRDPRAYTHLTVIRHKKMSKHKRRKWRKKMLAFLKKKYLRRNIKTEKLFRAELLAQIKEAEDFDAEKYVRNILETIDNMPKPETPLQKIERIRQLIRKNRRETNLIGPKFED